jgi:N-dimethylarginine dimethylaminohydrolase
MANLSDFPYYEPNKPPQYYRYHAEISFLDEVEAITGKRWGAQGIGKLREVVVVKPDETEVESLYDEDPSFFLFNGDKPDLQRMQRQHADMVAFYQKEGIKVHYMEYPGGARSAYGPLKRAISAAVCCVVNGGALISREATPYWRGRSLHAAQYLSSIGCPILHTVIGKGVCEIGAFRRMCDDFIVGMLSSDCNEDGLDQVMPVLKKCGYREAIIARSPGVLNRFYDDVLGWIHADMWIAPIDVRLALIYPPWCDFQTIRRLLELDYKLIEVPEEEQKKAFACNALTLEPRRLLMAEGAPMTVKALRAENVEVIEIPYDEVMKYGGGISCTTGQLVRDAGPTLFD